MSEPAFFQVDAKLAALLGESYRSSEQAIKELVDNAWDADAEHVWISLPDPMTGGPITVRDDGTGMTPKEVKSGYLIIASDRRSRKGEQTPVKRRLVKGRKGIGKFAGLMAASIMEVKTTARGQTTHVKISKGDLLSAGNDLERIPLPFRTMTADGDETGTTVTLTDLNQKLNFPNPDRLKKLLVFEYGRETAFEIIVNGQTVGIEDVPGKTFHETVQLPDVGPVKIHYKIADGSKKLRESGIIIRVGGKVVGPPTYFGLEDDPEVPRKLLGRIYGEIEADGLVDDVTADWGAIIENSKGYQVLNEWAAPHLKSGLEESFSRELNLQKARLQQEINRRLARLPEHRRTFAEQAIDRVLRKFFSESDEKVRVIVSLVLDALEKDEYWIVLREVEAAKRRDVESLAEALEAFGLVDIANIARQAHARLQMLDELEALVCDQDSLEKTVHQALEKNLWVFGPEYALMASNKTTQRIIREYVGKKFQGERANKRPDLFLARDMRSHYLLVELKRPSVSVGRDEESQAVKYQDDLRRNFDAIEVIVVGGDISSSVDLRNIRPNVKLMTYNALISNARSQLNWLIEELTGD